MTQEELEILGREIGKTLAQELTKWLAENVMYCDHGAIGSTCHICVGQHTAR